MPSSFRHLILLVFFFMPALTAPCQLLPSVHAWAYQLDAIQPAEIATNTTFDLMVMDYSQDGTAENAFTPGQIAGIQRSGKTVLAYLSIGEAEEYRFYWKPSWKTHPPAWLGPENPEWPGNYKVRFWDPDWQKIIFTYLDTILAQGFNGIYCDIIDAYAYWKEENPEQPLADSLMVQFLIDIRQYVENKTGAPFFIFLQNGEGLFQEEHVPEDLRRRFWATIDGIGVEDVFFPGSAPENNPFAPDEERLNNLKIFLAHQKPVLSVEYLTAPSKIARYIQAARGAHFLPYVTTRNLDRLFNGIATDARHSFTPLPCCFELRPNFPNPFNSCTTFQFSLPAVGSTTFALYDSQGRCVEYHRWQNLSAGTHFFRWDAGNLPSGAYFYRLRTPKNQATGKALLLK